MTEHGKKQAAEDRSKQQPSDTVEDLQPTEEASGAVKGGPIYMHGSGGGAGKTQT